MGNWERAATETERSVKVHRGLSSMLLLFNLVASRLSALALLLLKNNTLRPHCATISSLP
jgi:hypothetical protein